jgi:hypothetical protein
MYINPVGDYYWYPTYPQGRCPHCGYCPHCGQQSPKPYYNPWGTTGGVGGTISMPTVTAGMSENGVG